jgi:hypothetical protein
MKLKLGVLFIASVIFFFVVAIFLHLNSQPLSGQFFLSETKRVRLEKEATNGDGAAAYRLFLYYFWSTSETQLAKQWLELAMEKGNQDAIEAYRLLEEGGVTEITGEKK